MRMMRVRECYELMQGQITMHQLRYGIRIGLYKSARVGGVLVVDADSVKRNLTHYVPDKSYPGGLVTLAELRRRTGLTRTQIDHGIEEGWIVPVRPVNRTLYNLPAIERHLKKLMEGPAAFDGEDAET